MNLATVTQNRAVLAKHIAQLGHPLVLQALCADSRNNVLSQQAKEEKNPDAPKKAGQMAIEAAAQREDWIKFLARLHAAWVSAGQPSDGQAFLAGYLVAFTDQPSPFEN